MKEAAAWAGVLVILVLGAAHLWSEVSARGTAALWDERNQTGRLVVGLACLLGLALYGGVASWLSRLRK
jgi:hypothetical protein